VAVETPIPEKFAKQLREKFRHAAFLGSTRRTSAELAHFIANCGFRGLLVVDYPPVTV
jgi:hypothetical protein